MDRVTITPTLFAELHSLTQPVELCDEKGTILGHFVPCLADDPVASCPYSEKELVQMRGATEGRPLDEIWTSIAEK